MAGPITSGSMASVTVCGSSGRGPPGDRLAGGRSQLQLDHRERVGAAGLLGLGRVDLVPGPITTWNWPPAENEPLTSSTAANAAGPPSIRRPARSGAG